MRGVGWVFFFNIPNAIDLKYMLYYLFIYMAAGDWVLLLGVTVKYWVLLLGAAADDWVLLLVVTVDYWVLSLSAVIRGGDRLLGLKGRQMLIRSLVAPTCRVLDCF